MLVDQDQSQSSVRPEDVPENARAIQLRPVTHTMQPWSLPRRGIEPLAHEDHA